MGGVLFLKGYPSQDLGINLLLIDWKVTWSFNDFLPPLVLIYDIL